MFKEAVVAILDRIFLRFRPHPYRTLVCLLSLLLGFSYLPTLLWSLSTDPLLFDAGLSVEARRGLIPGIPVIDPGAGNLTEALGRLSAEDWLHGKIPWWNPYSGVGLPLAAGMQSSSLFFPFVLLLGLPNGVIYLRILMMLLAGVSTFALLTKLRLQVLPALTGSVLYSFNGTFAWFQHASILPLPFLPLLLLGIEYSAQRSSADYRNRGWQLTALAIALSLYAGFPETAYLNGLFGVGWFCLRFVSLPAAARLPFFYSGFIGCAVGLLLAAPALVPFLEYLKHSAVAHANFADAALPRSSFLQLLLPYVFGPIEAFTGADKTPELTVNWGNIGGFFGITAIFSAAMALWSGSRERRLRLFLGSWTVLVVARTIGAPGLNQLFHWMPAIQMVAIFRYGLPSCEMAVIILLAFFVQDWSDGKVQRKASVVLGLAAAIAFVVLGFWLGWPLLHRISIADRHVHPWFLFSVAAAAVLLAIATLCCLGRPSSTSRFLLSGVLIAEAVMSFMVPLLCGLRHPQVDYSAINFLRTHLGLQRYYSLGPIQPNYSAFFQIASINYGILPISDIWATHIRRYLDPRADPVTFSGNYPPPQSARDEAFRLHVSEFEQLGVKYLVTPPEVNLFLGHDFSAGKSPFNRELHEEPKLVFEGKHAKVFELPNPQPYFSTTGGSCTISGESRERVHASCLSPGMLIRRELNYPGWHVLINRRPAKLLQTTSLFQRLALPQGDLEIEFAYEPQNSYWSYAAASAGLLVLLFSTLRRRFHIAFSRP